jgi:glycosyltransferase involved in cell wall biosynthesis
MRLLFITQVVDEQDPVLGFVCGWLRAFAKKFSHISAVCLRKGSFSLPENVSVFSLGKERGGNKLTYAFRFLRFVWRVRREYDAVFVHMNQEYILLAGILWRVWGKKVGFWYNHTAGGVWTNIAMRLAQVIFHTSPYAYTAGTKKSFRMPAGIDTARFTSIPDVVRAPRSILYLGRIAPIKGVAILVEAVMQLYRRGVPFFLTICGRALPRDAEYERKIRTDVAPLVAAGVCRFVPAVPNAETPALYSGHEVFVNLTPAGNYDKTVLEAAACGCIPVVSSLAFRDALPSELFFRERDSASLADTLERVLALPEERKEAMRVELRTYVVGIHQLSLLVEKIYENLLPC